MTEMRESFERLETMIADLYPTDEADAAKAELIAALKRELESMRCGLDQLERAVGDWPAGHAAARFAVVSNAHCRAAAPPA